MLRAVGSFRVGAPVWRLSAVGVRSVQTEAAMAAAGIKLPAYQLATSPFYVKAQQDGDRLYLGLHVGQDGAGQVVKGKVGDDITAEYARALAVNAGLRMLSTLSHYCNGDLDKVQQVIWLTGQVNAVPDFSAHGKVIDGCSEVLVQVLGSRGQHTRSCYGVGSAQGVVGCELIVRVSL
mmetsp:Transcript_29114/g.64104  ORF Transcript_29114/g.64104 Transcript_29114/m.64104 type:complete len:178 (+) Transcript_29114:22-555(+)